MNGDMRIWLLRKKRWEVSVPYTHINFFIPSCKGWPQNVTLSPVFMLGHHLNYRTGSEFLDRISQTVWTYLELGVLYMDDNSCSCIVNVGTSLMSGRLTSCLSGRPGKGYVCHLFWDRSALLNVFVMILLLMSSITFIRFVGLHYIAESTILYYVKFT